MTSRTVQELHDSLREHRARRYGEIQARQRHGASGEQVVASLTDLADETIERLHRATVQSAPPETRWNLEEGLAIIALGGYGRGELAPFSDIDLMVLYGPPFREVAEAAAAEILQALWDIGYRVGHSLRTIADCIRIGREDLTVRTSLMEARFLAGNQRLFGRFRTRVQRRVTMNRPTAYIKAKVRDRLAECRQYGTTVYLLEPDVKMSQGGLRDLHLLKWAALCHYGMSSFETLKDHGLLTAADYAALTEAQEFLWQVRNELHFAAGRGQDRLTFEEQIRLATLWGFHDDEHLLAVEQFMKRYYEQTTAMLDLSRRLVDRMIVRSFPERIKAYLKRRTIDGRFLVTGDEISIMPEGRSALLENPADLLRVFHLAQVHNLRISSDTQDLITRAREIAPLIPQIREEATSVFLKILGTPGRVGWALRELHQLKLLEEMIPEFSHTRALMQFNEYHKYTVDEHSLRAVEEAEALLHQSGRVGQVYREIQRKDILHLALLIHDAGKGRGTDHSAVGAQIAARVAERLSLDPTASELLAFLAWHHLLMTHLAFRRDLTDETVLIQFAKTVATPQALTMLYILTLADVAAVGPGTLTAWKQDLLAELFENALEILTGERAVVAEDEKIADVKEWVLAHVEEPDRPWALQQCSSMTVRYLLTTPPPRIVRHLAGLKRLPSERVVVDAAYDAGRQITEYTVYASDEMTPGIFSKIAGVLAAKGLQILGAHISTWKNGAVVDTFHVQDLDFTGAPTDARLEKVGHAIQDVLLGRVGVEALLAGGQRVETRRRLAPMVVPTQVEVDNNSSEQYTILEVFARDRQGLLYIIAKAMFELGLSVHAAKVATVLDQVVDVFYVTGRSGRKVTGPQDIQHVKQQLTEAIERFHHAHRGALIADAAAETGEAGPEKKIDTQSQIGSMTA